MKNKSYPTITGKPGKKYTDPTVNAMFPINEHRVLNAPIFFNGLNILKSG